jgi:hypothetical protein
LASARAILEPCHGQAVAPQVSGEYLTTHQIFLARSFQPQPRKLTVNINLYLQKMPSPDRKRSRSPKRRSTSPNPRRRSRSPARRRSPNRQSKSSGGFRWKSKSKEESRDPDPRDRRDDRGDSYRPRRYQDDRDRARDDDRRRAPRDQESRRNDKDRDEGRRAGKRDEREKKDKKPSTTPGNKPPPQPSTFIIVTVNDRLGTKASIPCLPSDTVGKQIRYFYSCYRRTRRYLSRLRVILVHKLLILKLRGLQKACCCTHRPTTTRDYAKATRRAPIQRHYHTRRLRSK